MFILGTAPWSNALYRLGLFESREVRGERDHPLMKTVLIFFAILAIAGAVPGDTIVVCPDGCEFNDIQAAIDAASDGDVIDIAEGTYQPSQPLNTNGKAVTLLGSLDKAGSPTTTIDGQDSIQLLRMTNDEGPGTIVQNIEFIRGSGESGGAIHCTGVNPVIRNCIFDDNFALLAGGGIYCFGSNPFVYFCTFTNNRCSYDGGGSCNLLSSSTFELCVFESNIASGGSGGGNGQLQWQRCGVEELYLPPEQRQQSGWRGYVQLHQFT